MHSLPSPCSVISTIHFPILLLLLSSLDISPPDPNNAWQQSFMSSGHHLLVLSASPHLLTPKGSNKRKPMLAKAVIHLEPVKNDFSFCLRSIYPQTHFKPKNVPSLKKRHFIMNEETSCTISLQMPQWTLHITLQKFGSQSHNLPSKLLQAFTCQKNRLELESLQ